MPLFGKKKTPSQTLLLLDVESGSVAAALATLSPTEPPKLFAEVRVPLPIGATRDTENLLRMLEQGAREAVSAVSEVAARLRAHPQTTKNGMVSRAAVVMGAPWGRPNFVSGKPDFMPHVQDMLSRDVYAFLGVVPVHYYTLAGVGTYGMRALAPQEETALLLGVHGEVSELILLNPEGAEAHATIPVGYHHALRTLRTHAGLSEAEARSALRLSPEHTAPHVREAAESAAAHFAEETFSAMKDFSQESLASSVVVLAHEPMGEWFARALTAAPAAEELFPKGGSVRALGSRHASPYIGAHAANPDLLLMLAALFVDSATHPQGA